MSDQNTIKHIADDAFAQLDAELDELAVELAKENNTNE